MFLYALEMSRLALKKLLIVTVDTGVVLIALYAFWDLDLEELWIEFGKGKDRKWLPVHAYVKALKVEIWRAIIFWYAFTGFDTVSQFLGKGKKTPWNTWRRFLEATETFIRLSCVSKPLESDIKVIEKFVVLVHDASCPYTRVNDYRKYLFSKLNRTIDQCPPTKDALQLHILGVMLQIYIWSKSTQFKEQSIALTDLGWDVDERRDVNPMWATLTKASKACKELKNYNCKNLCSRDTFTCKTYAILCSELCRCDGLYENWYHFFYDEGRGERTQWNLFFIWLYIYK